MNGLMFVGLLCCGGWAALGVLALAALAVVCRRDGYPLVGDEPECER